jgi:hypothetical protein
MLCPHCGAIMVYEKFYWNNKPLSGWKCILCGEYVDDVIIKNRLSHKLKRKRTRTGEGIPSFLTRQLQKEIPKMKSGILRKCPHIE